MSPAYDSLLAKVIVWAPDRDQALARMHRALGDFQVSGPGMATTIPFLREVLDDPTFRRGEHGTDLIARLMSISSRR